MSDLTYREARAADTCQEAPQDIAPVKLIHTVLAAAEAQFYLGHLSKSFYHGLSSFMYCLSFSKKISFVFRTCGFTNNSEIMRSLRIFQIAFSNAVYCPSYWTIVIAPINIDAYLAAERPAAYSKKTQIESFFYCQRMFPL